MKPEVTKEAFKAGAKAATEIFKGGKVTPATIATGAEKVMGKVAIAAGSGAGAGAAAGATVGAGTAVGSGLAAGAGAIVSTTIATGALIGSGVGVAILGVGYGGYRLAKWLSE